MIVIRCLGCSLSDLPIGVLRCPGCGEENFMPEYGTLSAPESHPEPINDTKNFCDASVESTGEAKATPTSFSPNQHEKSEPMSKNISFWNEGHTDGIDGTKVKVKWSEGAGGINSSYQNINWKQKQQLQNCSNDPAIKNKAIQEIPNAYDQAYSFNNADHDACESRSVNFLPSVSAQDPEPQNRMNISCQPQGKLENQSSIEVAFAKHDLVDLSRFKNEHGEIYFAGCNKCYKLFSEGKVTLNAHWQNMCDSKPYKCEKCLCRFSARWRLKGHQLVHSVEKPFKCDQCDYTGKYLGNLKKHIENMHKEK